MGTCIICGVSTDGPVCSTHEEDVAFVFEGNSPDQLTPGRYYRGTVDGYADFGLFVNIGDSVTGLLHRSELDRRLESLEWDPGDTVFVQVTEVRENGDVDLGWSIRQSIDEFRGTIIDAPSGDRLREPDEKAESADAEVQDAPAEPRSEASVDDRARSEPAADEHPEEPRSEASVDDRARSEPAADERPEEPAATDATSEVVADDRFAPADIETLPERIDEGVRIEGEITGVRQTGGPTIFELRDETGTVECAAFEGAGVRAFPEVEVGDYVRLDGDVERRRGELQVETETLLVLAGEERDAVAERIHDAIEEAVRPDSATFLLEDGPVAPFEPEVTRAATIVRRAIKEARPVVVRHAATADGYAAAAAIERAALSRVRDEHARSDAEYHYFTRRPTDDAVYGMEAVTSDVTDMLQTRDRHGEQLPLLVLVGIGSTEEAIDAFELLDVYGVDRIVIDDTRPAEALEDATEVAVNPHLGDASVDELTSTAMASAVAATVDPAVADDLRHLPAISYWESPPEASLELASAAGYDRQQLRRLRESLALEAHYQSYNDKRELISDLLFGDTADFAAHVAGQFEEKLEAELSTAGANLSRREVAGVDFVVLDADAFTHRFDFPPTELLLDALHRREREEADGPLVTIGIGDSDLRVRSTESIDVDAIVRRVEPEVPGTIAVGGSDGHVEFLVGNRDEAVDETVAAIADEIRG